MRRGKTETAAHEALGRERRAAMMKHAADPSTRFERCAECKQAAGIVTGYVRVRDHAFICSDCLKPSEAGKLRAALKECEAALALLRHRGDGSIEGYEVDKRIGEARRLLYGKER